LRDGGGGTPDILTGPDHPVHPALPESAYLKTALLQIS
jgi:23S rRNA G2069 N7-methylase RlmK/C1962 C5-methylase RlmI